MARVAAPAFWRNKLNLDEFDISKPFYGRVLSTERLTPHEATEVRHIEIEVDHDEAAFEPGHSIGLLLPGPHAYGHKNHLRLYSLANIEYGPHGKPILGICVRRLFYVDEYSGESYPGLASNYLCDVPSGQKLTLTGPYGMPFPVPGDSAAPLIMVGLGVGIAPFRALLREIYRERGAWSGPVRLFHGARTGLELLYHNDHKNDFAQYYDEETFQAIKALSPEPHLDEPVPIAQKLAEHVYGVWELLKDPRAHLYVAGSEHVEHTLEKAFQHMAGGLKPWTEKKTAMQADGRYAELLY